MKRFVEGEDRSQSTLFPERLDDYICEDNPVRVVEAFVQELDLGTLGFDSIEPESYRPASLPSRNVTEDLYLRLSQPDSVQPAPGARDAA